MRAVASLKICTLMRYFCQKHIMFEQKKYRGVICHNTEEWGKIWGRTDSYFDAMRKLANFDPTLKSLKMCTSMDSFWPKYITFELKKYT